MVAAHKPVLMWSEAVAVTFPNPQLSVRKPSLPILFNLAHGTPRRQANPLLLCTLYSNALFELYFFLLWPVEDSLWVLPKTPETKKKVENHHIACCDHPYTSNACKHGCYSFLQLDMTPRSASFLRCSSSNSSRALAAASTSALTPLARCRASYMSRLFMIRCTISPALT